MDRTNPPGVRFTNINWLRLYSNLSMDIKITWPAKWDKIIYVFPNFNSGAVEGMKIDKKLHRTLYNGCNYSSLRWRHDGRDSVSNHQPHDCLLNGYSGADQRKKQSSASLAFVRGIHRGPVNSPHKWPVTLKMFPFDDVIMFILGLKLIPVVIHIILNS